MLEYFGFYAPPETETEIAAAADEPPRELVAARAATLGDRRRHTPSPAPAAPAWESGTRER
jgi:hypothetical protein